MKLYLVRRAWGSGCRKREAEQSGTPFLQGVEQFLNFIARTCRAMSSRQSASALEDWLLGTQAAPACEAGAFIRDRLTTAHRSLWWGCRDNALGTLDDQATARNESARSVCPSTRSAQFALSGHSTCGTARHERALPPEGESNGEPGGNRTHNPQIKSPTGRCPLGAALSFCLVNLEISRPPGPLIPRVPPRVGVKSGVTFLLTALPHCTRHSPTPTSSLVPCRSELSIIWAWCSPPPRWAFLLPSRG